MMASRVLPRVFGKQALSQLARPLPLSQQHHHLLAGAFSHAPPASVVGELWAPFHQITESKHSYPGRTGLQLVHFSSSASSEQNSKESNQQVDEQSDGKENDASSEQISQGEVGNEAIEKSEDSEASEKSKESGSNVEHKFSQTKSVRKRRRSNTKRSAFSDSDEEADLSVEDLIKLVAEKDELLKTKNEEFKMMQDKVLRSYAEMENVIERTKREAENSKKFGIQNFAKSLLDVADNLGRASSVGKDSLSKIESTETVPSEAVQRLKELLGGVEMTVKQLTEVFKKHGVEQFDPLNEQFDPNKHNAVVQVPDASKPPGTVSVVLKTGYILHGRIIRPAEVVVVSQPEEAVENQTEQSPAA